MRGRGKSPLANKARSSNLRQSASLANPLNKELSRNQLRIIVKELGPNLAHNLGALDFGVLDNINYLLSIEKTPREIIELFNKSEVLAIVYWLTSDPKSRSCVNSF